MSLATPLTPALERQAVVDATAPCLYCGGTDYQPLYAGIKDRLGHVPGQWSFMKCQTCGSAMLSPTPKAVDLPAFYPPVYTFAPELAKPGTLKRWLANLEYELFYKSVYRAQIRIIDNQIRKSGSQRGKLLDIGCGRGLRLLEFQKLGYQACGMDICAESIDYLSTKHGIPGVCTDIEGLSRFFEASSFDLITSFFLLEHVVDVGAVLSAALNLLKPGGWFVGAVPLIDSTQASILGSRNVNVREAPRHISIPTRSAILDSCRQIGFAPSSLSVRADSVLNCAASASLSIIPNCTTTQVYGSHAFLGMAHRVLGALGVIALIPVAATENFVLHRPVMGIVFARRPNLNESLV